MGTTSAYLGLTEQELVPMCVGGDGLAWGRLIDRNQNLIYSIALKSGFDPSECEDVVQNVALVLHRSLNTLEDHLKFRPWLIRIVKNECIALLRHRKEDLAAESDIDERVDPSPAMDEAVIWGQTYVSLHESLATLDDRCRLLIELIYFEGLTFPEAAARLGRSPEGIGPKRLRCFDNLRRILLRHGIRGLWNEK